MNCAHTELNSEAKIIHIADADAWMLELTVVCTLCRAPFRFLGPPTGLSFAHPTVDVPATTLHAPIAPGERTLDEVPDRLTFTV